MPRAPSRLGSRINWPRVEGFLKFGGIRIEDDLAVTASRCENLTRDAFEAHRSGRVSCGAEKKTGAFGPRLYHQ